MKTYTLQIHEHLSTVAERSASDAAVADLLEILNPQSAYQRAYQKACAAVPSALAQLRRSGRGCQALADFGVLLRNGGNGLDSKNWATLAILFRGGLTVDEIQVTLQSTLCGSVRGQQALKDFLSLLRNGGDLLDSDNRKALETLCRAEGAGVE